MKEALLKVISEKGKNDFAQINVELKNMFESNYEGAKTALRDLEGKGLIKVKGDLFRLGATWGESKKNWKGEQMDGVAQGTFDNIPVFAMLSSYETVNS